MRTETFCVEGEGELDDDFNFGGEGYYQQQQQPSAEDFLANSEVFLLNIGDSSNFFRRNEIGIRLFYKPVGRESREIREPQMEFAKKWYGILKVAAFDCE
jgi:hypothetical protein